MLAKKASAALLGKARPRIGPPSPLRHDLAGYREVAASLGIEPMPWQDTAAKYLTAQGKDGRLAFREVAIVVARQAGKTTLVKPLIVARLRAGRRIMHIAQVRELPRIMFEEIADALEETDPDLFPKRRGKIIWPRRGAGSESILLTNGGTYRITAASTGAARGHRFDDLVIDELREMDSNRVIDSAGPAMRMSDDPQTVYLSNAGTDESVVLNALRARAGDDPSLAYLEWSADPEFSADDRRGWVQANPSIGHYPQVLRDLEKSYTAASLSGNMAGFETEALCRWVHTMRPVLVTPDEWDACRGDALPHAVRPSLAVSMDPDRARASVAMAFEVDGVCWLTVLEDVAGDPINTSALGQAWRSLAQRRRIFGTVGLDPMTDGELAKHFRSTKPVTGMEFANATSNFVERVKSGRLRFVDADAVGGDLAWTSRKDTGESGRYQAVRANDERPVTAALAAIRAVWLATGPPRAVPRVY